MRIPCKLCGDEHAMLTTTVVDGEEIREYNCPVTPHENRERIMRESPAREYEVCPRKFAEACHNHPGEIERRMLLFAEHGIGKKWSTIAVDRLQQDALEICKETRGNLGKEMENKPRMGKPYEEYGIWRAGINKQNQDERNYMIGKLLRKPCGICGSGDHQAINQEVMKDQSTITYECPAALKEQWDPDHHPSVFRSNIELCPRKYAQMYNFDRSIIEESFPQLKESEYGKSQSPVSWYVTMRNILKVCDDQKEAGRRFKGAISGEISDEDEDDVSPIPSKKPRSL